MLYVLCADLLEEDDARLCRFQKKHLLTIKANLNKRLEADHHMLLISMQNKVLPGSRKALSVPFQC